MTHAELTQLGVKWLKSKGYKIVVSELHTVSSEIPDIVGFNSSVSVMIEVKVSRHDFLIDKKKWFRRRPEKGIGNYRFYLCPEGVINQEDLPEKWGLLHEVDSHINTVIGPKSNIMPIEMYQESNIRTERSILYSWLRRL